MGDGTTEGQRHHARHGGRHSRRRGIPAAVPIALIVAGLLIACAPLLMDLGSRTSASEQVSRAESAWSAAEEQETREAWGQARAYNRVLAGKKARGIGGLLPYDEQLAQDGWPCMCYVQVESAEIELPVYHGTSEKALSSGAGHVEGTSLPVGGKGSNCCISAHSGIASGAMFDGLRKVEDGDLVTLRTLGRTLAYRVAEVKIVDADDDAALGIVPGRDLLTLITCTSDPMPGMPRGGYGVNNRRLVVVCERCELPLEETAAAPPRTFARALAERSWPLLVALAAALLLVAAHAFRVARGRRRIARPDVGGRED